LKKWHDVHQHVFSKMLFHLFYNMKLTPFLFVFLNLMFD
jgi:hypothetical protein